MCIFHYLHEIKISQVSCMEGIVLCPLKDIYFCWTFWWACYVPWVISSQHFSILRAHHSHPVHAPEPLPWPGVDSSFFANYWYVQSKLKLRVFLSQPLQNFWVNIASFLNHFKHHWAQQSLTTLFFPVFWINFTAWTVCSVLLKADCCHCQCDCFTESLATPLLHCRDTLLSRDNPWDCTLGLQIPITRSMKT